MRGRRSRSPSEDPWQVLGLPEDAPGEAINEARRRLAKLAHPDVGGSVESMQRINQAAEQALRSATVGKAARSAGSDPYPSSPGPRDQSRHDHPSFTVEVLPVDAFEGLLVVASWLGDVISDEPPYVLEVALVDPIRGWCRLDLVPDAGASTVSLVVAAEPGYPMPDIDVVRDLWIDGLNRIDWVELDGGPTRQRP